MRGFLLILAIAVLSSESAAQAQQSSGGVTVESYYRLNWGTAREWVRLYTKNEAPVYAELQRQGLILSYSAERPFTHISGDARWDFRVRVTYRDAETAVAVDGTFAKAWEAAVKKLFPKPAEHEAEERHRSAIIEEHWDVIVRAHSP